MLSPYRVLDCTDDRGQLAGLMLAQLGAEVILVEPPDGTPSRRRPPFICGEPGPDRGLWHWAYNRGKQSVVVDTTTAAGRRQLTSLATTADVLLWSGRPAHRPFDVDELTAANPGLVVVALTPFGLDGPKADWLDSDLVVSASACQLVLTGDTDRPPLRMGSPQAYLHGAADAAVAALVALAERQRSGRGQLVDVSAQVSCVQASFCYSLNEAWSWPPMGRSGDGINMGGYKVRWTYPAKDGEVTITLAFGAAMEEFNRNLFHWIWEQGGCDEATRDKPWADMYVRLESGEEPISEIDRIGEVIAAFTARHTKAELTEEARRRRVLLAPIATLAEVLDNDHLVARSYWDRLVDPVSGRTRRVPGRFVVASGTPLRALDAPPALGGGVVARDRRPSARPPGAGSSSGPAMPEAAADPQRRGSEPGDGGALDGRALDGGALAGLKVVDLTWSIAGPLVGRNLADFGATVIKVETRRRPDLARTVSPFHPRGGDHPLESSGMYANCNTGKLGLELDLSTPGGRDVFWDLVRWADVVVESFSAGALERMGLGYGTLSAVNPSIVLLSTCLPGQTGTLELPGYGNLTTALFGFTATTRWPDRPASGPFGAYTDVVSPRFGLAAVLAALDHRRRTGEGQHLDLSQAESSLHFLAPALLDTEFNGHELTGRGNIDDELAPHGVYPTAGADQWIAIVCTDDDAWRNLAHRLGRGDLAGLDTGQRLDRRDELDDLIAGVTSGLHGAELQVELQALGIAAHQVQNSHECLADTQLAHRGHFVTVEHPILGPVLVEGPRFRLTRTPGATSSPPTYGQHAAYVLGGLLGYDDDRIAELATTGALGG